jgi:outer membrane protein assembly factor BamB
LQGMFRVCQPQTVGDEQVLLPTPMSGGTRLISVRKSGEGWTVDEKWTSTQLTPYFNDFVLQNGHLYGFDGTIFACVDVATGKRLWKKGRYGSGQVLMVGDAGVAIIIAESGEAVLATVSPEGIVERGRFPALTGKTWNHPVVTAGGKLLVRNSEQMACYDLLPLP